jgi:hypothetical protein
MTKILKELPKKHGRETETILDFSRVRTLKSSEGKFAGFPEEDDDAQE